MKYFKNLFKYLGIAVIALSLVFGVFVIDTPNHVHAAGDRFFIMGQVFVSSNTATITEVGRRTSTLTLNKTAGGAGSTFTIYRAQGITAVVTSGTTTITGSPVTLTGGSNTLTCDATNGTITLTLTIGTAANWNTVQAWAATSGGTGGAAIPTSAENALFDANSFTAASQVVTVDATASCLNMDWTGATNTPTLALSTNTLIPFGNVTFITAMSTTTGVGGQIRWADDGSLTTNGLNIVATYLGVQIGGKTLTFNDNFSMTGILYIPRGVLNTAGKTVICTDFLATASEAKTITLSSSIISCASWVIGGTPSPTLTANTSTINCSGSFTGGGLTTYNTVKLTGATSTITGNNTFATLGFTRAGVQTITFTDGSTQTVGALTRDAGTSIKTLRGSGAAGWNIAYNGASYISQDYFSISRSAATPAVNKFYAGTHSTNGGNNIGWNFYAPDVPTVTIQAQTTVDCFAVIGNGTITNLGAGNIAATMTGFRWGLAIGIYPNDIQQAGAYPLGAFTEAISSLPYHTAVFMQAEAQNSVGWGYSAELTFTTPFVGSPTNFIATAVGNRIDLTWVAGSYSTSSMIIRGVHSYPTAITDGSIVYSGAAGFFSDTLISDPDFNQYYYSAFGVVTTNVSPTYSSATNGGIGMISVVNYIFCGVVAFIAVILTVAAYAVKRTALAMLSAIFWMVVCGVSLSQLSTNVPVFTAMSLIGFIAAIGMSIQAYGFRDKDEDGSDNEDDLTFEEQLKKKQEERHELKEQMDANTQKRKEARQAKEEERAEKRYKNG
jgi:hypothetical protein